MTKDDKNDDSSGTEQVTFRASTKDVDQWRDRVDNMSGSFRSILEAWNEIEEEHDIPRDSQRINEIVLQTYINSLDKNIMLLEKEKEKLEEKLEDIRDVNTENEVLVKIDLSMAEKGL